MSPPTFSNIPVQGDVTPAPAMYDPYERPQRPQNQGYTTIVTTILGIVISVGVIVGVLGKAFFVMKDDYSAKVLKDVEDRMSMDKTLEGLRETLKRQEQAFEKLSVQVQKVQDDLNRRK